MACWCRSTFCQKQSEFSPSQTDHKLEMCLYFETKDQCRCDEVRQLIRQKVDCNWTYFDFETSTFSFPIGLVAERRDRNDTLCLLYRHRNYPIRKHVQEHLNFYSNYYNQKYAEYNKYLLLYTVNHLLHADAMKFDPDDYHILIVATHDYDNVTRRGVKLCMGSHLEMSLLLRIVNLVRQILTVDAENTGQFNQKQAAMMKKELLHNLETYYLIYDIRNIPLDEIDELSQPLLTKFYECIATNIIKKIKQLAINDEYTIPTGWERHAVCVSFRRINKTHVHVRVDNSLQENSTDCVSPVNVQSKILGRLALNNLKNNLDYFVKLVDASARDIPIADGKKLIYNTNSEFIQLEEWDDRGYKPDVLEQAEANCFLKCFEFGFRFRLGKDHQELCNRLLSLESVTADWLKRCCEEKIDCKPSSYYIRFAKLANENRRHPLLMIGKCHLQNKLKASYKEKYQYLPSFFIDETKNISMDRYVHLKLNDNGKSIDLENIFVKPHVLLIAHAGCGKTTICEYITYRWSCNKLWKKKFTWLFYIKIRNLSSMYNCSLLDIVVKQCFQGYQLSESAKRRLRIQLENPSKILWIIDGLDERAVLSDDMKYVVDELLLQPNLLLTSRPYVTHDLQYDINIAIDKFTEKDIEDFPDAINFAHLEYLAFQATASDQLTLSSKRIRTLTNGKLFEVVDIGLLVSDGSSLSSSFVEDNYSFIHRSFQEYLCCRYMIRILTLSSSCSAEKKAEVLEFIANKKYDWGVREIFCWFFQMNGSEECSNLFWSAVDREPRDLVGLRHCARILNWFPDGSCAYPSETDNVDTRTKCIVEGWISNEDRRGHDFGNKYLFDWFYQVVPHDLWWTAWKNDLFMTDSDPSKRRYFLVDLWSPENIAKLQSCYESIAKGTDRVEAFHRLIQEGPIQFNLKPLHLDHINLGLPVMDDKTSILKALVTAQEKARQHQEITDVDEFKELLKNYSSFAQINRDTRAYGKEVWALKIAESVLHDIDNNTLKVLLELTEKNQLFYRDFSIPVLPFLQLLVTSNDANEKTLCSLIVSIALSSTCIVTASPSSVEEKLIRIHVNEKIHKIKLTENRWSNLLDAFVTAREIYGYAGFVFQQP